VILEGLSDLLHRLEPAAPGPAIPARDQRLGLCGAAGDAEDLAQGLLNLEGAVGLEVELPAVGELHDLPPGPGVLVLQPQVAGALEFGGGLRLLAADLVDGLVDQLDDVKRVEGDVGPGQGLGDPGAVAGGHVDADVADVLGAAPGGLQILGKLVHYRGLTPLAGEQQARGFQVVEQADVVVAATRGGLVQAHRGDGGEVLLRPGGVDVVVEGAPYTTVAHPQELGDLTHRHGPRQGHDQGLHQLGEPAALARPGHRHLGGLAAGLAAHPRDLGAEVRLVLEEVQMPPHPLLGVVHRLVLGPAVRADEAAPRGEADPKVDAPGLGIEGHLGHLPRRLADPGPG
jgi:hypothetical protein